jgi:hypothetical protein
MMYTVEYFQADIVIIHTGVKFYGEGFGIALVGFILPVYFIG